MSRFLRYVGRGEKDFLSPAGEQFLDDFLGQLQKDGTVKLKHVGQRDITAEIQSYEMEADINVLVERVQNGDLSAFTSAAVYGDFTNMPMHPADMFNTVIEAEREFNHLPVDVKLKFGNDFKQWFATIGSDDWLSKMDLQKVADGEAHAAADQQPGQDDSVKKEG